MLELLGSVGIEPVFFCGGASNEQEFFDSFELRFGLCTSNDALVERLQVREPQRWMNGSVELQKQLEWNDQFINYCQKTGAIKINSSVQPDIVADSILGYIQ